MSRLISPPKIKADKLESEINTIAEFFELEKRRTLRLRFSGSIETIDDRVLAMQKEITDILLKYEGLMLNPRVERFNAMFKEA